MGKNYNFEDKLFHGLSHYLAHKVFDQSLKRLDYILKTGAILSRNKQRELLTSYNLEVENYDRSLWNGEDYISICTQYSNNSFDETEAYFMFCGEK